MYPPHLLPQIYLYQQVSHYVAQLADLYNNDAIFDKFECCLAKDNLNFATGSYRLVMVDCRHITGKFSSSNTLNR